MTHYRSYYYLSGRYGNFLSEARYTNLYHAWAHMGYAGGLLEGLRDDEEPSEFLAVQDPRLGVESSAVWLPKMVDAVRRAVATGKQVCLGLNMQVEEDRKSTAIAQVLKAMAPFWKHVLAVELADEPKWTRLVTQREMRKVKLLIQGQGLAAKPCFIVYTGDQIHRKDAHRARGLDGVGIEAYLDYIPGETPAQAARRMVQNIAQLLAKVSASKKIVMVWQAYSRNYTWQNIESLVAIQKPIYDAAVALGDRLICSNLFSYGRPSGTREYPELKAEHKRLFRGQA